MDTRKIIDLTYKISVAALYSLCLSSLILHSAKSGDIASLAIVFFVCIVVTAFLVKSTAETMDIRAQRETLRLARADVNQGLVTLTEMFIELTSLLAASDETCADDCDLSMCDTGDER